MAREWAPQPTVCWHCGVHVGTRHRDDCPFEGVFMDLLPDVDIPVRAIGSTDAQQKAKQIARGQGYKIRTVASIRVANGDMPNSKIAQDWIVRLAVRA